MMTYITFSTGLYKSSKANSATSKAEIYPQTLAFLTPEDLCQGFPIGIT